MRFKTIASILFLAVLVAVPVQAEDEKTGWHSTADFGLVVTGGNAESETIAFKDETKRVWDKSSMSSARSGPRRPRPPWSASRRTTPRSM